MPGKLIITKIEKQKKGNRYNIYLNDLYAFSVHEDILVSHRLLKNNDLSELNIKEVLEKDEENKAWNKSLRYLSYRNRTEDEIRKYLIKQSYENKTINIVIKRLKEQKYLNDKLYASSFIQQRITLNPKGKKMIAYELFVKGISKEVVFDALSDIDEETEYNMALRLLEKKVKEYKSVEWNTLQDKLGSYLQRKGFPYGIIIKALQETRNKLNSDSM